MSATMNLKLIEGHSKSVVLRWEIPPIVRKAIVSITAPNGCARINVPGHGIPNGWRVAVTNCKGMTKINADLTTLGYPNKDDSEQYHAATVIDADTIELNELNIADFPAHTANTGFVQYNTPAVLTNHTQRMRIREKKGGNLLVCTQAGTTGATKPTAAGVDGTVTWAKGSPSLTEKVWVAGAEYSIGDVVDTSILASSQASDAPLDVLSITTNTTIYTILLTFPATASVLLAGKKGFYDVEDVSPDATPVVTQLVTGTFSVDRE